MDFFFFSSTGVGHSQLASASENILLVLLSTSLVVCLWAARILYLDKIDTQYSPSDCWYSSTTPCPKQYEQTVDLSHVVGREPVDGSVCLSQS